MSYYNPHKIEQVEKTLNAHYAETVSDVQKHKIIARLLFNLNEELLTNLENTVITAFEQEGKNYLSF